MSCSPGFEGGQMPLYRRMPKLVGRPMGPGHVRANYGLLKVDVLNKCAPNSEVTYETCLDQGLMTKVLSISVFFAACASGVHVRWIC
jgi:ribosomal protein L15